MNRVVRIGSDPVLNDSSKSFQSAMIRNADSKVESEGQGSFFSKRG
jgi:hypothetical protein